MPAPTYKILYSTTGYYLAGNPMIVQLWPTTANARYRVYTGDGTTFATLLYQGAVSQANTWSTIDIRSLFAEIAEIAGVLLAKVVLVDDANAEYGTDEHSDYMTVFGGGISKLLMRKLKAADTDIFTWKLKNNETNFWLSTRSNNTEIFIPENELLPLCFYAKDINFDIRYNGDIVFVYQNNEIEKLVKVDFNELRKNFLVSHNKWINEFRVMSNDGWACTIVITEVADTTPYYLKFRNSWGVWEKIALYAEAEYTPELSTPEEVQQYDADIAALTTVNRRKTITNRYRFNTGFRSPYDRLFVLDALHASHTLLVAHGVEYAASFTLTGEVLQATEGSPINLSIAAKLSDSDIYFSPLADDTIATITAGGNDLTSNSIDITT